jgi:hypothetical protein
VDIRSVTPTVCRLMHVPPPKLSSALPLPLAVEPPKRPVERCLIYCPDAIGAALLREQPGLFARAIETAPTAIRLRSMLPPKTPVCFASMFTGALPEAHGIRVYERPVLTCDTIFDALVRAGRRVALAAVRDCSVDTIFRNRKLDYHSEPDDAAVTRRALTLLAADRHDVIVAYHQEYDDTLHRLSSRCPEALAAANRHVDSFAELAAAARSSWGRRPGLIWFAPDHGAHEVDGKGTHGDDIPEDMEVTHFVALGRAEVNDV